LGDKMYSNLPKNESTFDIKLIGETTNVSYEGQFTVTCVLNVGGTHGLELERTRLIADYANPTGLLSNLSLALATLRAKIVKAPDWWYNLDAGAKIKDSEIIMSIFILCEEQEQKWRSDLQKKAEESDSEKK